MNTVNPSFSLLKAKCSVIANHQGVQMGDLVLTKENE